MKVYYKVVKNNLCSAVSWKLPSRFIVQYKIGEWVYPNIPKTRLMVFKNLNRAQIFSNSSSIIFTCLVKNPSSKSIFVPLIQCDSVNEFLQKWNELRKKQLQHKKHVNTQRIPKGTMFVSAVKLLKQVC